MPHSFSRRVARAGWLLVMPAALMSCEQAPRSVAGDHPPAAASTSTLELESSSELHPDGSDKVLSADEWHQPLAVGAHFLQQLLSPTDDDDPRRYATTRLASELVGQPPDASSRGDRSIAGRVASVRMLRRFVDWATAVAIVERGPRPSSTTNVDGVDVYVLTFARQQDDRWLVADIALR